MSFQKASTLIPKQVTILGATGSIGKSTLDIIALHPDRYKVFALTGYSRIDLLKDLCSKYKPFFVVVPHAEAAKELNSFLQKSNLATQVLIGCAGLREVATHAEVDVVVAAIVGAAGLESTFAAVVAGKRILLANKEALVMSGALFMQAAKLSGAEILPIDSEHNAIFQCLPINEVRGGVLSKAGVRRLILTASGGPFRNHSSDQLKYVTPEQACRHPNWSMGQKISVDSASMMNKGLELIEACWLFDISPREIDVVIHPQSIIHSLVEYLDGSVLAQLSNPDMRVPIAHALAWPERIETNVKQLDLFSIATLDFSAPDEVKFPCLRLAKEVVNVGGVAPTILNAANEVAVSAFLKGYLRFDQIADLIDMTLNRMPNTAVTCLDSVLDADKKARLIAIQFLERLLV